MQLVVRQVFEKKMWEGEGVYPIYDVMQLMAMLFTLLYPGPNLASFIERRQLPHIAGVTFKRSSFAATV